MRILSSNPNVDNSDLVNFPDGRIKDNDGSGNGTGINERTNGDIHQTISRLMRKYGIIPNNLPDNVTNGFQIVEAIQSLASKNDFVLALTDVGGVLSVPIKFSFMDENESVICKSGINLASQTQIKGSDATTFNVTYVGSFKNNEYVRVIKTASGVTIVRLGDAASLDAMVTELNFLKKATQAEENAGVIDTKATTPLSNLTAFIRRVIGVDSGSYLATAIRNGLYPKEHFDIVENIGESPVRNVGWISGLDVGQSTGSLPVSGNIVSANAVESGNNSKITVEIANAMANMNYVVKIYTEAESADLYSDNSISQVIFKKLSITSFQIGVREFASEGQSLKIHIEVVQL